MSLELLLTDGSEVAPMRCHDKLGVFAVDGFDAPACYTRGLLIFKDDRRSFERMAAIA
jgi:hypothetical protein